MHTPMCPGVCFIRRRYVGNAQEQTDLEWSSPAGGSQSSPDAGEPMMAMAGRNCEQPTREENAAGRRLETTLRQWLWFDRTSGAVIESGTLRGHVGRRRTSEEICAEPSAHDRCVTDSDSRACPSHSQIRGVRRVPMPCAHPVPNWTSGSASVPCILSVLLGRRERMW